MSPGETIFASLATLAALGWIAYFVPHTLKLLTLQTLESQSLSLNREHPRLSVIVAARNQESTLRQSVDSLVAQDYPNLEVILVNDRSTDATGKIIDELARQHSRVRALHIESVPEGWLGKVHALNKGCALATGELFLFADADVLFRGQALRRAVGLCLSRGWDHLVVCPKIPRSFSLLSVLKTTLTASVVNKWVILGEDNMQVQEPVGIGAFNLVRREAIEQAEGLEWLRMELLDDVGLGVLLHRHLFKSGFVLSHDEVCLDWYNTTGEALEGLHKNVYAALGHYRIFGALSFALQAMAFCGLPLALVDPQIRTVVWPIIAAAVVALLGFAVTGRRRAQWSFWALLLFPLGVGLILIALVRAVLSFHIRGELTWRGTTYPAAALLSGHRVQPAVIRQRDWIARYFRVLDDYGEDFDCYYGRLEAGASQPSWHRISHIRADGLYGLVQAMRHSGIRITRLSENRRVRSQPAALMRLWLTVRALVERRNRISIQFPLWRDRIKPLVGKCGPPLVRFILFSREETRQVSEVATSCKVSKNSLLLWALNRAVESLKLTPRTSTLWHVPVSLRGMLHDLPAHFNMISNLLVVARSEDTPASLHEAIKARLQRQDHWALWYKAQLARFLSYRQFRKTVLKGHEKLLAKEETVLTFSNLGALPDAVDLKEATVAGSHDHWLIRAPTLYYNPISITAVTWNGRLSLTLTAHPSLAIDSQTADAVLEKCKTLALTPVSNPDIGNSFVKELAVEPTTSPRPS